MLCGSYFHSCNLQQQYSFMWLFDAIVFAVAPNVTIIRHIQGRTSVECGDNYEPTPYIGS